MRRITYISVIFIPMLGGCVKPFSPPSTSSNSNILVVEGLINAGGDSTIIKLSRTVIVANKTAISVETKAILTIEDANGTIYTLPETTVKGTYATPPLKLDNAKQYRLRIKTSNGKTYLSDLVDVKIAPPIDSIGYSINSNGLQIYANTHDATNNTRYYKYSYRETWQFNSAYNTPYITDGTKLNDRLTPNQIHFCWGTDTSANTVLNSTAALSQDIGYQVPIVTVDATSEKVETKYSILVSQQALTKDAYNFWELLRKNTEQLGSIFDAQPSAITGNIHNVADATEPVIGYISAGALQKKRIYISKAALPQSWLAKYPYECHLDTAYSAAQSHSSSYIWLEGYAVFLPIKGYAISLLQPGLYYVTSALCADCTLRGTTKQPTFWK